MPNFLKSTFVFLAIAASPSALFAQPLQSQINKQSQCQQKQEVIKDPAQTKLENEFNEIAEEHFLRLEERPWDIKTIAAALRANEPYFRTKLKCAVPWVLRAKLTMLIGEGDIGPEKEQAKDMAFSYAMHAATIDSDNNYARAYKALMYFRRGHEKEASDTLNQMIIDAPGFELPYLYLGAMAVYNNRVDSLQEVVQYLEQIEIRQQLKPRFYNLKRSLYANTNNFEALDAIYQKELKEYPDNWKLMQEYGGFLVKMSQYQLAIEMYEKSLAIFTSEQALKGLDLAKKNLEKSREKQR